MIALEAEKFNATPPEQDLSELGLRPDPNWSRWWQVVIAAIGLLLLSPVALVIAVATKLTSRGPILYSGTRIGRNMQPFTIHKFRTLLVDAEQRIGARLLTPGDPLYTPVGRFLKLSKLDEIPQLWNVIRGDMNLVGPRPIRPVFLATSMREIRNYAARFIVRPGMTGLAQLRGGYFTHPRDKLRYDVLYIRNRSPWLDVKLVVATFVKLANKWLTLGLLLGLVFLCVSFAPGFFRNTPFDLTVYGFHLSPFEAIGMLAVGAMLVRQIPSHRLYLYRTPTNLPIACFVTFSVVAGLVAGDLVPRLRDLAYFTASGFVFFFLLVSGDMNATFARRAARFVALVAVGVALVGIFEMILQTQGLSPEPGTEAGLPRVTATLGSPVVLAAYLVLGLPLVLVELVMAERREERDFWLICTTLVMVAVLLTQTRTALVATWITAALFTWRLSRRTFRLVVGAAVGLIAVMVLAGALRFSPTSLGAEFSRRAEVTVATVSMEADSLRGLVGTQPGLGAVTKVEIGRGEHGNREMARNENMHLTLLVRVGLVGWALMMWIIAAALVGVYRGSLAVRDRRMELILWAVFSSGVGFVISMTNFNAFYNPTIQILFWGLLGMGMAIVTHLNGRRPTFNVIYRFGQGE